MVILLDYNLQHFSLSALYVVQGEVHTLPIPLQFQFQFKVELVRKTHVTFRPTQKPHVHLAMPHMRTHAACFLEY